MADLHAKEDENASLLRSDSSKKRDSISDFIESPNRLPSQEPEDQERVKRKQQIRDDFETHGW